jgi:hypothetical protein
MKAELPTSLKEIRILRNNQSNYLYNDLSIISQLMYRAPTILNIMIGDLYSQFIEPFDHFDDTKSTFSSSKSNHYMRQYGSNSIEHHLTENNVPFLLSKGNNVFQCVGEYVSIKHLFSTEIQELMQNEPTRYNFSNCIDLITGIFDTLIGRNLFRERRYLIVTTNYGDIYYSFHYADIVVNSDDDDDDTDDDDDDDDTDDDDDDDDTDDTDDDDSTDDEAVHDAYKAEFDNLVSNENDYDSDREDEY